MKSFLYYFIIIVSFYLSSAFGSDAPQVVHNGNLIYLAHTVIIKYRSVDLQGLNKISNIETKLNYVLKDYNVKSIAKTFASMSAGNSKFGIDRIMTVNYSRDIDPLVAAAKMKKLPDIEWAEPKYVRKIDFVPNDPQYDSTSQWNLYQIKAKQAWDISQGDTSIIIGIIDTGIDWIHPDIRANMWAGIGYDFGGLDGTPDNNPIEDNPYHGTFVAGVASAVTDNGIGVSSIGFKSHLMAVKTTRDDFKDPVGGLPYILYGFEGILYAADHGAKVINCSWGGGGFSNMEQDVINYALSKGALVVAAAGNDNLLEDFYPASYNGVFSVAATTLSDRKASFSSFGFHVDCSAPGLNIYSTWQPNSYTRGSGTSFSTPLVSGLAALVFSRFPNYTPLQVAEQIRVNCDNIDLLNPGYINLLGFGRVNAFKTLNNSNSVSLRAYDIQFSDQTTGGNGDGIFQPGENVEVRVKFRNFLSSAGNVSVSLQSLSGYASVVNGNFNISSIGTLDSVDNYSNPFILKIAANVPYDDTIAVIFEYNSTSYSDYQTDGFSANSTFETQQGNNISLTLTSRGNLGFNDYPNDVQGQGFNYMRGPNLLFEGSLMFGTSAVNLSDEARDESGNQKNTSFQIISPFKLMQPGEKATQEGNTVFNDDGSGTGRVGVTVNMHSYSFNDDKNKNSIILNYNLLNTTNSDINNFYTGLFIDWDLLEGSGDSDYVFYDNIVNLGYAYHSGGNPDTYVGTALISSTDYGFWAIANGGDDNFQIYDGFSKDEKWQALSSGIGKTTAGPADISEVTSGGPFFIRSGKSINVAFAITAGSNLDDLRTNINNARDTYNNVIADSENGVPLPLTFTLSQNYPNPFNPGTEIDYQIPEEGKVTIKVYDILGNLVKTLVNEDKRSGQYHLKFNAGGLASGIYFYTLKVNTYTSTKKFVLIK